MIPLRSRPFWTSVWDYQKANFEPLYAQVSYSEQLHAGHTMNSQQPIYTEKAKCHDCYKCVRGCPVKAIQVTNDCAAVMPDRCVYCGACVKICPAGAKKLRNDLSSIKLLLRRKERVIVSLAPSFASEFPGLEPEKLIHALKALGFWAVSETALGAQEVSRACAIELENGEPRAYLSTACPTIVELIRRYHPEFIPNLTQVMSPVLAHCKMLRREFGDDIGIVLISPCISKKLEADANPGLLNVALTFNGLRKWLDERGIDPALETPDESDVFVPEASRGGALYPVDGGMIRGVSVYPNAKDVKFLSFSGIHYTRDAINGLRDKELKHKLFIELLACDGGCINGPKSRSYGTGLKWLNVIDYAKEPGLSDASANLDFSLSTSPNPVPVQIHDPAEIARALRRVGKLTADDEVNCGGCGYNTCRNLAEALLDGRAEPNMCVSYMRKLATNKANALIRSMPAGVALVDENLSIIECNRRFAEIIGKETLEIFEFSPGMNGADMRKVAPELCDSIARGFENEIHNLRKDIRAGNRIIRIIIFTVEPERIVGCTLQDITEPAVQREMIIQKAQEVIHKNVTTVQQIAFLLGENAAETEIMLESLTSSFSLKPSSTGDNQLDEDSPNAR